MKVLVTGGCGFIGSHFIRLLLSHKKNFLVLNLDKLTYAGRGKNLADLERNPRYRFLRGDIGSPSIHSLLQHHQPETIVNFAAESHVDRSVHDSKAFMQTNSLGVQNLIDAARKAKIKRFIQVSTDEVYGSIDGNQRAKEDWPLRPSSPYSASKSACDLYAFAAHHTFGQNIVITRCTNNYGPYQFPEKLIPLIITNALHHLPLPVYGDGQQKRDWIHVEDHCRGIFLAMQKGKAGEIYNFGIGAEIPNLWIIKKILKTLNKSETLIQHVRDRLGHDRRYAVDCSKACRTLGWKPLLDFEIGLVQTIQWYQNHTSWWLRLKDTSFKNFYQRNYGRI